MRLILMCLLVAALLPVAAAQVPHPHDDVVHHPLTIQAEMEAIRDRNPEMISMGSFGKSVGGFDLWYLDFAAGEGLPVYYLDANHHGNEQLGMEALLIFMDELAQWSLTEEGAARLAEVRVVAAPMINPDGTGTDKRVNTRGVDLNRNYDYNWGKYGTSDMMNPLTGTYRGEAPLSEPETHANAAFMRDLLPRVYLSMHTGSHDIVLPWNQEPDRDGPIPDWQAYESYLAEIENVSALGYRDPSGAGESISYAYGALGAVSLIVEVDRLQTQVLVEDIPETLKEEVAIFWRTLEVFERIGGHLVVEGGDAATLRNEGWGHAYNVTHTGPDGETLLAPVLAPNATLAAPAGTVTYQRVAQGDLHRPMATLEVPAASPGAPGGEAPLPALSVLVAVGAAVALRRRPA